MLNFGCPPLPLAEVQFSLMEKRKLSPITERSLVPIEIIERRIYLVRGEKVMLDRDLADLYGVETRVLGQAVMRNIQRFPHDFMFQLTKASWKIGNHKL